MTIDEAMNSAREMLIYRKLEELNKVKQELTKVSQELEVYKKRLVDVETENKAIRKELATYMRALEHACTRLEGYDLIFDREYGCYASKWNRKRWELWAIDKAEEDLKNE